MACACDTSRGRARNVDRLDPPAGVVAGASPCAKGEARMTVKLISLLKRIRDHDVAAFQEAIYLRAQVRVVPQGCSRFVQSHTLLQGYRKGQLLIDAIEEYWFD